MKKKTCFSSLASVEMTTAFVVDFQSKQGTNPSLFSSEKVYLSFNFENVFAALDVEPDEKESFETIKNGFKKLFFNTSTFLKTFDLQIKFAESLDTYNPRYLVKVIENDNVFLEPESADLLPQIIDEKTNKRNKALKKFLFQNQLFFLITFIKKFGQAMTNSARHDDETGDDVFNSWSATVNRSAAATFENSSSGTWIQKKIDIKKKIQKLEKTFTSDKADEHFAFFMKALNFLNRELDHYSFLQKYDSEKSDMYGIYRNIDSYLDAVYTQYELENKALTEDEANRLSEKLLRYQLNHEDCLKNDPHFKFLKLLAGHLDKNNVNLLLENGAFSKETFDLNSSKHNKIQEAVEEFKTESSKDRIKDKVQDFLKEAADNDDNEEILNKSEMKQHFKRLFTNVLVADAEASGRYVLLPAVATHRDESYYQVLHRFGLSENQLPFKSLIKNQELRSHFALLVAANTIANNVIVPKRWQPRQTFQRAHQMKKKALFLLSRILPLKNKRKREELFFV